MQHSFCISLKNRGKDHFPMTKENNLSHHLSALCPPSLQFSFPVSHQPPLPPSLPRSLFFSCLFFCGSRIGVAQWPDPWREKSWKDAMTASPLLSSSLPPLPLPSSSPPPSPFFLSFHQSVVSAVTFIWKLTACPQQQEKEKNGEKRKLKKKPPEISL